MAAAYLDQLDDIGSERTNLLPRCTPRRCGCGTVLTVFVLGLGVIFPLSWQTLPYSEMGLDFNQISGKLDTSRAYERGRHLVGLGHVFIKFPRTIQTIDFAQASELETETSLTSIPVISADGQMVRLECSVWYRLVPDKLGELYSKYATRYASNVAKAARQGITEASSLFDTVDFYQSRARVREAMKLAVAAALASYTPPHRPPPSSRTPPPSLPHLALRSSCLALVPICVYSRQADSVCGRGATFEETAPLRACVCIIAGRPSSVCPLLFYLCALKPLAFVPQMFAFDT